MRLLCILGLLLPALAPAQKFYTYVGRLDASSVLLAWGTTQGSGNTIGQGSASHGRATVRIADSALVESQKNWVVVSGLQPDTDYPYEVLLGGRRIGGAKIRTWPQEALKLAFFVIGDYGSGVSPQYEVAEAMRRVFEERQAGDNPVRFVLTTGDNVYASRFWFGLHTNTGDRDRHWGSKFFRPYESLLNRIPFYPTLGNHDHQTESRRDMTVYLDNFFFPAPHPAQYYRFSFGGLADFFALDSTFLDIDGSEANSAGSRQYQWLEDELSRSQAPWKIPYFHHPPFNAGPGHGSSLKPLQAFVDLFGRAGVKIAFNGHEHNFQWSEQDQATRGVRYVITGAGGQLRSGDVRASMQAAHIAGWAPQYHFLLVEIEDRNLAIHVLG
ncbi:MAG: hypothetical protein EHM65_08650, partial [Acidobacteriales bacterium]